MLAELVLKFHNLVHKVSKQKSTLQRTPQPLRAGVLGAASINWTAFFDPVDTHPDIVVVAVAARSLSKANEQISRYSMKNVRAYGSYEELLADPEIDVVYTAGPNGLHVHWATEAMKAGKHVLVEKPIASNASEVKIIRDCSLKTGKVVMEAMHWRFHPAAHTMRSLVQSGKYGPMQSFHATMMIPSGTVPENDIRFQYDLAGGVTMDFCYTISTTCYFAKMSSVDGSDLEFEVKEATPRLHKSDSRIDVAMDSQFILKSKSRSSAIACFSSCDLSQSKLFGLIPKYWDATPSCYIDLEGARINLDSFIAPYLKHAITISRKDAQGELVPEKPETVQCYQGGPVWGDGLGERWWTTYRYQLEAFVDMVRKQDARTNGGVEEGEGEELLHLVYLEEAETVLKIADAIYQKAGLPLRKSKGFEEVGRESEGLQ